MDVENFVNRLWEPALGWLRSCRIRVTTLGARLTTPLGTTCLAVVSCGVGLVASGWMTVPGSPLSDARERAAGLEAQLQEAHVQLAHRSLQEERLRHVQEEAARHDIPVELASMVHDLALVEGMRPELAFRLVAAESTFRQYAVSEKGAVGFTQIKPSTARLLSPDVTEADLFDAETNLRLGFRYLRLLLERYDGDMRLALLAYNRGPTRVGTLLALGRDPANGYARKILTSN